jgi:hypothetical protein
MLIPGSTKFIDPQFYNFYAKRSKIYGELTRLPGLGDAAWSSRDVIIRCSFRISVKFFVGI